MLRAARTTFMKRNRQTLEAALSELDRQHLRRHRRTVEGFAEKESATSVLVDGRCLINFCSNDYLGLARHPEIAAAMSEAALRYGSGSGASHLVTGHGAEHAALEEELAEFTGRERTVLFSTGYMANLAAITTFAERGDLVLLDRLSHASLIDGGLLARAEFARYSHADAQAARRELAQRASNDRARSNGQPHTTTPSNTAIIVTDGVFSMDGDVAPLPELAALATANEAWLIVDDAHGLGVLGASGRGTIEHFGLSNDGVPLLVGTFGKAFGSFGAFIAADADVIEMLVQRARTYVYTTALPQAVAAATRTALKVMQREFWRRERVLALTARFRAAAQQLAIPIGTSSTPIQPVLLGSSEAALSASERLFDAGFWVSAIRPPTVPRGEARLRVTLSAAHTDVQVDALVEALSCAVKA
jgi:8-amino-7-oxononanoate synthase